MPHYKVDLENFEGPFDLLLYLIKKDEIDIYDIPIAKVTEQYLEYIDKSGVHDLNNAGEFLVMAATLMYIKSKMLLPIEKVSAADELNTDPRDELVNRLIEYKKYKEISNKLKTKEIEQDKYHPCKILTPQIEEETGLFEATLFDLVTAFDKIYKDSLQEKFYEINPVLFRVEEKIEFLQQLLNEKKDINFKDLFANFKHKIEIVVTFLAILELMKRKEIIAWQSKLFSEIWISKYVQKNEVETNTEKITQI